MAYKLFNVIKVEEKWDDFVKFTKSNELYWTIKTLQVKKEKKKGAQKNPVRFISPESKDKRENLIGYNLLKVVKGSTEWELPGRYLIIATEGCGSFGWNRCQGNVYGKSIRGLRFKSFSSCRRKEAKNEKLVTYFQFL